MRCENWPIVLDAEIQKALSAPFVWGQHDCCMWAMGVVLALTGVDPVKKYRGKYKTPRGAMGVLKRIAGGGVREATTKLLGEPVPVAMAHRGDLVLIDAEMGGGALTVCNGAQLLALTPDGLTSVPRKAGLCAWRIE